MKSLSLKKSFTLIELLIVIAIIAILAGVVISVINPVQQRRKAQQGVMRANLAKMCQALVSCQSSLSSQNATLCNSATELGVSTPTQPTGATYSYQSGGSTGNWHWAGVVAYIDSNGDGSVNSSDCRMRCVVYNGFYNWAGQAPGTVIVNADGWSGCAVQQ